MIHPHPIRTEADHAAALAKIECLWGAKPGTPEGDALDILATLVEAFEQVHWPIELPTPIEALRFRMEARGWEIKDMAFIFGTRARAWEVLNRKRSLTLPMIKRLVAAGVPARVLVQA
jgi:HTH-type transcriptional regulator/antitoxin HigA